MEVMEEPTISTPASTALPPEDALTAAAIRAIVDEFNGDVMAYFQDAKNRRLRASAQPPEHESALVRSYIRNHIRLR